MLVASNFIFVEILERGGLEVLAHGLDQGFPFSKQELQ